jgi:hypothetical protein
MLSAVMNKRWILAAAMLCGTLIPAHAADWRIVSASAHHVDLGPDGKGTTIAVRTTGNDPYVIGRLEQLAAEDRVLEFEYFCPAGIQDFSAFLGPPFSERRHAQLPDIPIAEGWRRYTADLVTAFEQELTRNTTLLRLDLGTQANVRIQLRGVRVRPRNAAEIQAIAEQQTRRAKQLVQAEQIAAYLQHTPATKFAHVSVQPETITLRGAMPPGSELGNWRLVEFRPHQSIDQTGIDVEANFQSQNGLFQIVVPRRTENYDRRFSGWRIRHTDNTYVTARQYPTAIEPATDEYPAKRLLPKSQKGLSGISPRGPLEEIPQLGVSAVTLNLVLNRFLSASPGPDKQPLAVPGPPVFFNTRAFDGYDALIDFARKHELVVSAIVLIPSSRTSPQTSPLVHPAADGGVYAMPDLSTERGAMIYTHVLDRIARRYCHPGKSPGAITNWIAHNEVDFHPVWTNMGRQPRAVFTETYYRSMRMINNAARSYNPHARVFASLTHHWTVPDDGKWNQLAPREVLETLARYSRLEGELGWGVAFHPYPQSLFAKVAWQDSDVGEDFDTPLITMQNIDVLGRFLDQPSLRAADGSVRRVLLSEQGYHTDNYEDQSQANQAASLWYAMNKVRQHPWIESFHYHRWIDHPNEGGLMLGLRTLPTKQHPHGEKKRSWYVYQGIGTEREAELTQDLPGRSNR